MGIVSILLRAINIGERQEIQFFLTTTTCRIDREQNWEGDAATNKANYGDNFQKSKI